MVCQTSAGKECVMSDERVPVVVGRLALERGSLTQRYHVLLVFLFITAIFLIIGCINAFVGILFGIWFAEPIHLGFHPLTPLIILLLTFGIVGATWLEWYRLRQGGQAIARRLNARPIQAQASVSEERQLLNVIESLSLAAHLPIPAAFVLDDEESINSLVAGYHADDMVLIVTWGALQTLDREELSGLIAHEFRHIQHDDPHLNLRLMSVLGGLLLLNQMGHWLMHNPHFQQGGRWQRWRWFGRVLGMLMWVIGIPGVLLGRFIKLVIIRQKEFLADSGSVEYTRSMGVLRTLLRIRAHPKGSQLDHLYAESISHFCFASAVMSDSWFSTHPSLDDRIGYLDPQCLHRLYVHERLHFQQQQCKSFAHLPAFAELINHPLSSIEWQPPKPLPSLRRVYLYVSRDEQQPFSWSVRVQATRPDAIKRALLTGAGCRELLAAMMVARQGQMIVVEDLVVSRALVDAALQMDVRLHLAVFHDALIGLGDLPDSAARQLLYRLARIIQMDGCVSLADMLWIEWLKGVLHLLPETLPVAMEDCTREICILIESMLQLQQQPALRQAPIRERLLRTILSPQQLTLQALASGEIDFGRVLQRLAGLPRNNRLSILAILESSLWSHLSMTQEEYDVWGLLHWRLGVKAPECDIDLILLSATDTHP
jgi:Zn-dependent protease with chaperone function